MGGYAAPAILIPALAPPSGQYQYPASGQLGTNTLTVTANRLYAMPFVVGTPITIDRIGFEITTGSAGGCRMGVYAHDSAGNGPGALLSDFGIGDTTSIAVVEITGSLVVPTGVFWVAGVFSVTPTVRRVNAGVGSVFLGYSANNETGTTSYSCVAYGAHTYGALPAAFPSATVAGAAHAPKFHVRRA